jgi:hypothetical protein
MVEIVICTFKRIDKQITLNNIPESYRDNVTLVVQPQEAEDARKVHKNIFVLDGDDIGYAKTIKQATYEWAVNRQKHFWLMDDDLSFHYNDENWSKDNTGAGKKYSLDEEKFYKLLGLIDQDLSNGLMHSALGTTWVIPWGKCPYVENSRICGNKIYNKGLAKVWNEIDWEDCCGAEDFYVNLQLLTKGYANKVWFEYVISPGTSYADGGCSDYRTLEYHNQACRDLHSKFPQFVRLKENVQKSGPWKDIPKLGCYVSWKKAYASSQINTLEGFMNE